MDPTTKINLWFLSLPSSWTPRTIPSRMTSSPFSQYQGSMQCRLRRVVHFDIKLYISAPKIKSEVLEGITVQNNSANSYFNFGELQKHFLRANHWQKKQQKTKLICMIDNTLIVWNTTNFLFEKACELSKHLQAKLKFHPRAETNFEHAYSILSNSNLD